MRISKEEVEHIANLTNLKLNEDEIDKYSKELGDIASFVEKLNEVDVTGVEPTAHVLDIKNVFRKDIVEESYDRETLLKNAPSKEAGCISVPKVVE